MLTKEKLLQQIKSIENEDTEQIARIIAAWQRSKESPLAYIEELLQFQSLGFDHAQQAYVSQMKITDELRNRIETLHGGLLATFIDTSIGAAVFAEFGSDHTAVTLDLSVRYLSPGKQGMLTCYTHVVKKGNKIIVAEAKIQDEQGKLVATASSTFYRMK